MKEKEKEGKKEKEKKKKEKEWMGGQFEQQPSSSCEFQRFKLTDCSPAHNARNYC